MTLINYLHLLVLADKQCEELRKRALSFFPGPTILGLVPDITTDKFYCYTPYYQQILQPIKRLIEICSIFGIHELDLNSEFLREKVSGLEDSDKAKSRSFVNSAINEIKTLFSETKTQAHDLTEHLDSFTKLRLNEAIHCFLERCFYSSVIMSVSAIESRLLDLLKRSNPGKSEYLDGLTLGQLLKEYLENEGEYGHIIPKKYKPLLELCNTYRVFSAHPKEEKITSRVATSILNLTFEFLTDRDLN